MRKRLLCLFFVACFSVTEVVTAQKSEREDRPPAAPISCTADVKPGDCKGAELAFQGARDNVFFTQTEVLIADAKAFNREKARALGEREFQIKQRETGLLGPTAPFIGPYQDGILVFFDKKDPIIRKVVVSVDVFYKQDVDPETLKPRSEELRFDIGTAIDMANRLSAYVAGWTLGRLSKDCR